MTTEISVMYGSEKVTGKLKLLLYLFINNPAYKYVILVGYNK